MIALPTTTRIRGTGRILEIPDHLLPDSDEEFARWWLRDLRKHCTVGAESSNTAVEVGLKSWAAVLTGKLPAGQTKGLPSTWNASMDTKLDWMTARPYYQALGTKNTLPNSQDKKLSLELYRKPITSLSLQDGPLIVVSTYFNPTEVFCARTTVDSYVDNRNIIVRSIANFRVGDILQIATTQGFEYHTITAIDVATKKFTFAVTDTFTSPSMIGGDVNQCLTEAGMFGDEIVKSTTQAGKVTLSASQNATSNQNPGPWSYYQKGDFIRTHVPTNEAVSPPTPPVAGDWYEIQEVASATALTLTDAFTGTPGDYDYFFNGSMLNHLNDLKYVKPSTRGIVFENDWAITGA